MTIDIQPNLIQPAYGNLVYQFSSTAQTAYYKYRYIVDVYVGGTQQTRLKITPQNSSWGQVDISPIIKNYLTSRPINEGCTGTTETPITQAEWGAVDTDVDNYYIMVGEEYSTTADGNVVVFEPSVQGDTRYVYNGVKNWNKGKSFDFTPFYLSNYSLPTAFPANTHKFLTDQPRVQYISDSDWATLTAFNMNQYGHLTGTTYDTYSQRVYSAVFEFFDLSGGTLYSQRVYNTLDNCGLFNDCQNITGNTSNWDSHMFEYLGTGTKNLTNHGITIPADWAYYRVFLEGTSYECSQWSIRNESEEALLVVNYADCETNQLQTLNIGIGATETICARGSFSIADYGVKTLLGWCDTWGGEGGCWSTQRISEYFYYYKDPECGPGNQRVMWLNSFGTWEYFTFKYRHNVGYDIQRESLQREPDNYSAGWDADKYYGWNNTNRVWKQNISKTGLLYSGRISKSYLVWLSEELLKSPSVYFIDTDGDIQPIVLTNTEVIEPNFQRNDGEYEMVLEYTGGYNETRQDNE